MCAKHLSKCLLETANKCIQERLKALNFHLCHGEIWMLTTLVSWSSLSQVLPLRLAESSSGFGLSFESFFTIFVNCRMQTVKQKCWLLETVSCFPVEIISSDKPSPLLYQNYYFPALTSLPEYINMILRGQSLWSVIFATALSWFGEREVRMKESRSRGEESQISLCSYS